MNTNFDRLAHEHRALMRHCGEIQSRCSRQLREQAAEIERLLAETLRLRAALMARRTERAWRCEDLTVPADHSPTPDAPLEDSLALADLVICQAGCLDDGAYWRVQDHCRRTGKPCVLVERPDALRVVRIHGPAPAETVR